MSKRYFDKPILAGIKAANELVGKGWYPSAFFKDAWIFYGDYDKKEPGAVYALMSLEKLFPGKIQTRVVIRNNLKTMIEFRVLGTIDPTNDNQVDYISEWEAM